MLVIINYFKKNYTQKNRSNSTKNVASPADFSAGFPQFFLRKKRRKIPFKKTEHFLGWYK